MSAHAEDEPTGRVRRKTALPARYEDYDLTGFSLPKLQYPEPVSPHTQIPSNLSEGEDQQKGATAFSPVQITCDEPHSSEEWSDTELSRSENDIFKRRNMNLHHVDKNMFRTVDLIQQERDALQQTNQQYAQELSQLKRQMQQLQIQVEQQQQIAQPLPSVIPARQTITSQPIPAPRCGKIMQSAERNFRPMPAPRFRQRDTNSDH